MARRPKIQERDVKLLWGRSGNRCAFPDCCKELSTDSKASSDSFPLGIQAHIVGESASAKRGRSDLSQAERNSYFNLILLCPDHHTLIDKDEKTYTVERLHYIKDSHELWVRERLGLTDNPSDLVYASLIDHAVGACRLECWNAWASQASSPSLAWEIDAPSRLHDFGARIIGAIWPGTLPELECCIGNLSRVCYHASEAFLLHAEPYPGTQWLKGVQFYKHHKPGSKGYFQALEDYGAWTKQCDELIIEATKAANWFADVVRRDFNPLFFAVEGKFLLTTGPYDDLSHRTELLEYTAAEKKRVLREHLKSRQTQPA